jgi:hypothetical protein
LEAQEFRDFLNARTEQDYEHFEEVYQDLRPQKDDSSKGALMTQNLWLRHRSDDGWTLRWAQKFKHCTILMDVVHWDTICEVLASVVGKPRPDPDDECIDYYCPDVIAVYSVRRYPSDCNSFIDVAELELGMHYLVRCFAREFGEEEGMVFPSAMGKTTPSKVVAALSLSLPVVASAFLNPDDGVILVEESSIFPPNLHDAPSEESVVVDFNSNIAVWKIDETTLSFRNCLRSSWLQQHNPDIETITTQLQSPDLQKYLEDHASNIKIIDMSDNALMDCDVEIIHLFLQRWLRPKSVHLIIEQNLFNCPQLEKLEEFCAIGAPALNTSP